MFLYLSKLLPLFLYPLGLACLGLLVALVAVWKHPRIAAGAIALSLAALLLGSNSWVCGQLVRSLEWRHLPAGDLPQADAIVVLGGGTKPALPPRPGVDLSEGGDRILYGVQLYHQGKAPYLILSGGRISWKDGGPSEAGDMANLAQALGVPSIAILQDPTSLNTYQNAVNVKQILEAQGFQRILLVTSASHMPRAYAIFRRQGMDAIPAPTDFLATYGLPDDTPRNPVMDFLMGFLPDIETLGNTTKSLKEYLGLGVYRLRGWL